MGTNIRRCEQKGFIPTLGQWLLLEKVSGKKKKVSGIKKGYKGDSIESIRFYF